MVMQNFKEKFIQYFRECPPEDGIITLEVFIIYKNLVSKQIYGKIQKRKSFFYIGKVITDKNKNLIN